MSLTGLDSYPCGAVCSCWWCDFLAGIIWLLFHWSCSFWFPLYFCWELPPLKVGLKITRCVRNTDVDDIAARSLYTKGINFYSALWIAKRTLRFGIALGNSWKKSLAILQCHSETSCTPLSVTTMVTRQQLFRRRSVKISSNNLLCNRPVAMAQ